MSLYLLPQGSNIYVYAHWKSENARNFSIITFTKTCFQITIKPLQVYKSTFFFFPLPEMTSFAHISRTKVDNTKYNKLPHLDFRSLRVFLNNLKSTYVEFKSSHSLAVSLSSLSLPSHPLQKYTDLLKSMNSLK